MVRSEDKAASTTPHSRNNCLFATGGGGGGGGKRERGREGERERDIRLRDKEEQQGIENT